MTTERANVQLSKQENDRRPAIHRVIESREGETRSIVGDDAAPYLFPRGNGRRSVKAPRLFLVALSIAASIGLGATAAAVYRWPIARASSTATATAKRVVTKPRHSDRPAARPARASITPAPYQVTSGEVHTEAKQLASEIALRLTTYPAGAAPADVVGSPLFAEAESPTALEEAAGVLHHPGMWSRGTVVYPQLGGMSPDRSSVMVVVRQEIGTATETLRAETRTLDIRLERRGGSWRFNELASTGGTSIARPAVLAPEAVAVLDNPRIELPDSARWDIYRGRVSPLLLGLMARIAERTPYGVVVLESGHPINVFGTKHRSAHITGHAVDIYRLGDLRIIDDHSPDGQANAMVRWLYGQSELAQIGAPWALDGPGEKSFTDVVHQDHIHVAVTR